MRLPDRLGFRGKTLWDWLQLLIVPAILIGVTFAWSATQTRGDNKREDRRIAADRAAAEEARQDATLQGYLDQMSGLMLHEKLLTAKFGSPVRAVANTVTQTTLRRLNGERQGEVVRFLSEALLLVGERPPIDLGGTDLRRADLRHASLQNANLEGINLEGVNLTGANLESANLPQANLRGANLGGANLYDANLAEATLAGANLSEALLDRATLADTDLESANLAGAFGLDLDRYLATLQLVFRKPFLDSQRAFLDSLSPRQLAKFNLTPEQLAKYRREANG
jgi:uncharacterized protein YjbI with pentapeptide repeats